MLVVAATHWWKQDANSDRLQDDRAKLVRQQRDIEGEISHLQGQEATLKGKL
jgi:hypothetical protein